MRKIRNIFILTLVFTLLISTTCYAGSWKTMSMRSSVNSTSYTSKSFLSQGSFLLDVGTNVTTTASGNVGHMYIQRLSSNGEWVTVKTVTKSLNSGYTHFGNSYSYRGTLRIVFTSSRAACFSGTVNYFNE